VSGYLSLGLTAGFLLGRLQRRNVSESLSEIRSYPASMSYVTYEGSGEIQRGEVRPRGIGRTVCQVQVGTHRVATHRVAMRSQGPPCVICVGHRTTQRCLVQRHRQDVRAYHFAMCSVQAGWPHRSGRPEKQPLRQPRGFTTANTDAAPVPGRRVDRYRRDHPSRDAMLVLQPTCAAGGQVVEAVSQTVRS